MGIGVGMVVGLSCSTGRPVRSILILNSDTTSSDRGENCSSSFLGAIFFGNFVCFFGLPLFSPIFYWIGVLVLLSQFFRMGDLLAWQMALETAPESARAPVPAPALTPPFPPAVVPRTGENNLNFFSSSFPLNYYLISSLFNLLVRKLSSRKFLYLLRLSICWDSLVLYSWKAARLSFGFF